MMYVYIMCIFCSVLNACKSRSLTTHIPIHSLYLVFPARAPRSIEDLTPKQMALGIEPGEGRHAGLQAGYQLALLGCTLFIAIFSGLLTGMSSFYHHALAWPGGYEHREALFIMSPLLI